MKLKELYKKYRGYDIVVFGKGFDTPTIPFTMLPKDKPLMECEVADMRIEHKEYKQPVCNLDGSLKRVDNMKGKIEVVVR